MRAIPWGQTLVSAREVCIDPPPFGEQCTMLEDHAITSCLLLPACVALTCPDPSPYLVQRTDGISGPVCQARASHTVEAHEHGMCEPDGCINIVFTSSDMAARELPLDWAVHLQPRQNDHEDTVHLVAVPDSEARWVRGLLFAVERNSTRVRAQKLGVLPGATVGMDAPQVIVMRLFAPLAL
jgi:hypothetical protein